jgi:purine-nucleoside phosphorylase
MDAIREKMLEALAHVRRRFDGEVRVGIILGTGLGGLAEYIDREAVIDYRDIPNFPHSTALSHRGQLVFGTLAGVPVVAMQGRCHLYEGYSSADVGMPVLLMNEMGAKGLIVSNASGGMNPKHRSGDILVIEDHINLMWDTSLEPLAGLRRLRCNETTVVPYDRGLIEIALSVARRENFAAHRGVYVSVSGPTY